VLHGRVERPLAAAYLGPHLKTKKPRMLPSAETSQQLPALSLKQNCPAGASGCDCVPAAAPRRSPRAGSRPSRAGGGSP
jgi:hypothetical protein